MTAPSPDDRMTNTRADAGIPLTRFPRFRAALAWLYALGLVAVALTAYLAADRWWPATLLAYAPKWPLLVPLPVLLLLALTARRKRPILLPLALAILIAAFGVLGVRVSPTALLRDARPDAFKIVTLNLHRGQTRTADLAALIAADRPDVAVFQGWTDAHLAAVPQADGWHHRSDGALFVASRHPVVDAHDLALDKLPARPPDSGVGLAVRYTLDTPAAGRVHVINVHLASPHAAFDWLRAHGRAAGPVIDANSARRARESQIVADHAATLTGPVIIAGDFNTPPDSTVYRAAWAAFDNAFTEAGSGLGYTYVIRRVQLRIDHVLVAGGIITYRCRVERNVGSPHRPLFAELLLPAASGQASTRP
ncbi:MAG TPA: endonuclease/exonuclease/phosphatase family protein [Tepidisphaeraceae bacterium]|nr:endonuclease/exonuclease/phosphatase family protein [Tepidisphaeraceae bacterium]